MGFRLARTKLSERLIARFSLFPPKTVGFAYTVCDWPVRMRNARSAVQIITKPLNLTKVKVSNKRNC